MEAVRTQHFLSDHCKLLHAYRVLAITLLCCADEVNALVIDLGSHTVKAGYAGEDTPKALFPSVNRLQISLVV